MISPSKWVQALLNLRTFSLLRIREYRMLWSAQAFSTMGTWMDEVTRGWLKASCRAVDAGRSAPGRPFHPLTRESRQPVTPGEINQYEVELMPTANLFRAGHRIGLEITSLDLPTGPAGATSVEYIPYHVCSAQTVSHRIHRDARHPSHLLLPVIEGAA